MKKIFSIIILVITFACLNAKDIIVTDMRGNEGWLESGDIVAAPPKVLAQMLQTIAPHLAA